MSNFKTVILSFAIPMLASQNSLAAPQTLTVMGIDVLADQIDYFVDSEIIHSFKVVQPATFTFANGNQFTANETVYLDIKGNKLIF